eukprot:14043729-Alexandrium_andersonii.AAC.1
MAQHQQEAEEVLMWRIRHWHLSRADLPAMRLVARAGHKDDVMALLAPPRSLLEDGGRAHASRRRRGGSCR